MLGKIKYGDIAGCVEFMGFSENMEGASDEYIIHFFMGDDNPIVEYEVCGYELCCKIFGTIWDNFITVGYCDLDKFNEAGDYINYGILH